MKISNEAYNDFSRQIGARIPLRRTSEQSLLLKPDRDSLNNLSASLPVQRLFKLLSQFMKPITVSENNFSLLFI